MRKFCFKVSANTIKGSLFNSLLTFVYSQQSAKTPQVIELDDSSDDGLLSDGSDDLDKVFNFDAIKKAKQGGSHVNQCSIALKKNATGSDFPSSPLVSSEPLNIAHPKKINVCFSSQESSLTVCHTQSKPPAFTNEKNTIGNVRNEYFSKEDDSNDDDDIVIVGESQVRQDDNILAGMSSDISEISVSTSISSLNIASKRHFSPRKYDSLSVNSGDFSSISNATSSDDIIIEGLIDRPTKTQAKQSSPLRFNHSSVPTIASVSTKRIQQSILQSPLENVSKSYSDSELQSMLDLARQRDPKLVKQVNKIKKTKEDLTAEMVASFDTGLLSSLKQINPNISKFLEPVGLTTHADPDSYPTIRFHRKVCAVYFASAGVFVPVKPHIEYEKTLALFYDAKELPSLIESNSLDRTLNYVSRKYKMSKIVVFLNGYSSYLQSITTKLNRQYVDKVRKEILLQSDTGQNMGEDMDIELQPKRKRRKNSHKAKEVEHSDSLHLSAEQISAKLLQYEFDYNVHMFPIKGLKDLVTWTKSFGYTLSSRHIDNGERNTEFANIGTVKSGKDVRAVFLEMIQQFKFMTPTTASRFINESRIDTIRKLYKVLESDQCITGNSGRALLRKDVYASMRKVLRSDNEYDIL